MSDTPTTNTEIKPASSAVTDLHTPQPAPMVHVGRGFVAPTVDPSLLPGASPAPAEQPGYSDPSRVYQPARTPAQGRLGLTPDQINKIAADLAMRKVGEAPAVSEASEGPAARFDPVEFLERNPDDYESFIWSLQKAVAGAIGEDKAVELFFCYADTFRDEILEYFHEQWLSLVAPHVNPADLADLPKDLQAFVPRLRAEAWEELTYYHPSDRLRTLRELKNGVEAEESAIQAERDHRANGLANYQRQQLEAIEKMGADFEKEAYDSIADWAPYGDNQKLNVYTRRIVYEQAIGMMQTNPGARAVSRDFLADVELAGIAKLAGNEAVADAHASAAIAKQDKLEEYFWRVLAAYRAHHEALIADALRWREQEAKEREAAEAEASIEAGVTPPERVDRTPGKFGLSQERIAQIAANARRFSNANG